MRDNSEERFPVVDEEGRVIGEASRGECHGGSMLLHPVVHLHVFDPEGRLYLQRRPDWKDIQPGRWDTAVGGHVDLGEDIRDALMREAREELGLDARNAEFIGRYVFTSARERELIHMFRIVADETPKPSEELDGGRFWTENEIIAAIGNQILTPNFEQEYSRIRATPCRII